MIIKSVKISSMILRCVANDFFHEISLEDVKFAVIAGYILTCDSEQAYIGLFSCVTACGMMKKR
jgi:hypothetical protein